MKTIHCHTTFLDGRDRFEAGETRVVDDERADYLVVHGWARLPDGQAAPLARADATLDIQNVTQRSEVTYG